jgi:hypothetical protein
MNRAILKHYPAKGQTVNNETYPAMLKDKLEPAICNKRRGLLSKTVLLNHNTHPHVVAAIVDNPKLKI